MTNIQFKVGDAVQLRNGWEAEVLDVVGGQALCVFIEYKDKNGVWWCTTRDAKGRECSMETQMDLIHKPKRLYGFVNVYRTEDGEVFLGGINNSRDNRPAAATPTRIACIDLSQFEEGEGL